MRKVMVAALLGVALSACAGPVVPSPTFPTAVSSAPPVARPSSAPAVTVGDIPGDGEFLVGVDIQPGTYRSTGPSGRLPSCYVSVYDNMERQTKSMSDVISSKGSTIVTVSKGDKLVTMRACNPFTRVSE